MRRRLAHFFKSRREERGLSTHDVARLAGYTSHARKGTRRIECFEADGTGNREFLAAIFAAVGLSLASTERQIAADLLREEEAWLASWLIAHPDAQLSDSFLVRCLPAVYSVTPFPPTVSTPAEAVAYVRSFSAARGLATCLALTPELLAYFDGEGNITGFDVLPEGRQVTR